MHKKIGLFGGVYSNHLSLREMIRDAHSQNLNEIYCLGDLGAFGPNPDKIFPIIKEYDIRVVKGNYDDSIGSGLNDCQCGYTDPRDNYYAKLSYNYTFTHTSEANKKWLRELPSEKRIKINGKKILLCHGSPRQVNEFLWETTTPTHFLEKLCKDYDADIICATHTGIHWNRKLTGGKRFINVGVIGRPENDGTTEAGYTIIDFNENDFEVEYRRISYDYEQLASEMKEEKLPKEFIETILTGWWTTCLEILPGKERLKGKF